MFKSYERYSHVQTSIYTVVGRASAEVEYDLIRELFAFEWTFTKSLILRYIIFILSFYFLVFVFNGYYGIYNCIKINYLLVII